MIVSPVLIVSGTRLIAVSLVAQFEKRRVGVGNHYAQPVNREGKLTVQNLTRDPLPRAF